MFNKIWQISGLVIFISLLAIVQFSLISAWPDPWRQLNLGLLLVTFTLFFFPARLAFLAALLFGLWLDLLSFNFLGFYLIPLVGLVAADAWLANNWLTNRSLYSFVVLILLNTLVYNLLMASFSYFSSSAPVFFLLAADFWSTLLYQAIWGLAAAILFFHLAAFLTKKIKPFFLEKKMNL